MGQKEPGLLIGGPALFFCLVGCVEKPLNNHKAIIRGPRFKTTKSSTNIRMVSMMKLFPLMLTTPFVPGFAPPTFYLFAPRGPAYHGNHNRNRKIMAMITRPMPAATAILKVGPPLAHYLGANKTQQMLYLAILRRF